MKTLQSTLQFNEFFFFPMKAQSNYILCTRELIEISHVKNPNAIQWVLFQWTHKALTTCILQISFQSTMQKESAKESIFYEAQWNFLIHNKLLNEQDSSLCPFSSNEKQGTSKINKIKITKIWEFFPDLPHFKLSIKPSRRLWFWHTPLQSQKA